ncbi:MAG: UDP-N-acetylmuramoyl-tripeptide--D-alanyl-D-alanine ligase [Phycisphaerae bacterium]|nr:UDP-N-acetylmuramoyl-tripeptide--D-alanyl-D-alanine ligase [Phycisphaerae bacterium]
MNFWHPESLRALLGGTWVSPPARTEVSGVSTDTREIGAGQAFVALAGERFDGHAMLADAAHRGSPLAIIDNPAAVRDVPEGLGLLRVGDTRRALLRLAEGYRRTVLDATRVIAVGGSNGKTTTVRLIDAVLGQSLRGSASVKSFNNSIGVPLTVLAARPGDQYLVAEVGTNARGEIGPLASLLMPDIAVVVSIGREHLERLGSVREVAQEEASLLEPVRPGGAGVVHAEAPHLDEAIAGLERRPGTIIRFGAGPGADVRVVGVEATARGQRFRLNDRSEWEVPLLGRHNALNAAAAVAVGRRLGVPEGAIARGLLGVRGAEMRLQAHEIAGVRVINDAYNANPDSMRAALATLVEVGAGARRRVAVLGDMLEMGAHREAVHREIGAVLAQMREVDVVVLVGESMQLAGETLDGRARRVADLEGEGASRVAAMLEPGDVVLLKGSRRMRLERVEAALRAR